MQKLSIITICYNTPNIKNTCESIINQTWTNYEWIVIDGGSNKETLDILNDYKSRMTIFISEADKGIYDAINKGILNSSGEWINFMNAGDSFASKTILEEIFNHKEYNADMLLRNVQAYTRCQRTYQFPFFVYTA